MMYFRNLMGGKFEIPENAIQYTSVYGKLPLSDSNITKHQYNSGIGYVTYNSDILSTVFRTKNIISITLPPTITTLDELAFDSCSSLTTLTLPNTIRESRNAVFEFCSKLQHVHIPDLSSWLKIYYISNSGHPFWAVTSGDLYINGEKLTDITIPEDITTIPFSAFRNCKSLTNITIPNHVTAIERLAFDGCDITKIVIPDSVVTMGDKIFRNCTKLGEITLPQSLTAITELMFYNCNKLLSIVIPENVTTIGKEAFYQCHPSYLKSINIPKSITTIGADAFKLYAPFEGYSGGEYRSISNVYIKDLSSWCKVDFENSSSNPIDFYNGKLYLNNEILTELVIPEDITEIKNYTFKGSNLKKVTIHDNVTSIGYSSFGGCILDEIIFGRNITFIGYNIYDRCNKIHIPNLEWLFNINYDSNHGLYNSGKGTIYIDNQPINDIVIPESITKINDFVFKSNDLITSINIHNGVTTIGNSSFYGMSALNSVTIGDKVTYIGPDAFAYDKALTSISMPPSIIKIGYDAFYDVTSLKSVYITDLEAWLRITFNSYASNPVYNYLATLYLNNLELTDLVIPESITELKPYAFYNHKALTSITIPNSGIHINNSALSKTSINAIHIKDLHAWCNTTFYSSNDNPSVDNLYLNGELITTFVVPDDVEQINDYLFYKWNNEVVLGKNVKSIKESAFLYSAITSIILPEGLETILDHAFKYCDNLKSINIPTTLTYIGNLAFYDSTNIERVDIADMSAWYNILFVSPDSNPVRTNTLVYLNGNLLSDLSIPKDVTRIKDYTFRYFPITSVLMHDDITSIGNRSFYECANLTTIHISNKVTLIDLYAFYGCISLTLIVIPDSVITLSEGVFRECENLEYIKIGSGVETIPLYAFYKCTSLKTVVLGSSVKNIENYATSGCTSLESIYIKSNTVVNGGYNSIPNNTNIKIYVPFDLVEAYNSTYPWYSCDIIGFDFENNDI